MTPCTSRIRLASGVRRTNRRPRFGEERIIVSADTDFATLLALRQAAKPSFILFRRDQGRRPQQQAALTLANLGALIESLERGCVVVFDEARMRIRPLPIEP
jgi:predicted nuclease of predicted toxin-antitoxin system